MRWKTASAPTAVFQHCVCLDLLRIMEARSLAHTSRCSFTHVFAIAVSCVYSWHMVHACATVPTCCCVTCARPICCTANGVVHSVVMLPWAGYIAVELCNMLRWACVPPSMDPSPPLAGCHLRSNRSFSLVSTCLVVSLLSLPLPCLLTPCAHAAVARSSFVLSCCFLYSTPHHALCLATCVASGFLDLVPPSHYPAPMTHAMCLPNPSPKQVCAQCRNTSCSGCFWLEAMQEIWAQSAASGSSPSPGLRGLSARKRGSVPAVAAKTALACCRTTRLGKGLKRTCA